MEHEFQRLGQRLRLKRRAPGQQMIQRRAQGIHVGAPRDTRPLAGRLFGRQVVRRTQHLPGDGQFRAAFQPPGQAEIHQVRLVLRINQNVGGLQIAVQNTSLMGVVYRLGDGLEKGGRAPGRQ